MTLSVEYVDHMGSDLTVADCARVSFAKKSALNDDGTIREQDVKLINYLASHNHISPFHHPQIQVRVTIPIFIARQLEKHVIGFAGSGDRIILDKNEVSRRYVKDDPEFFMPDGFRRKPEGSVKQGSSEEVIEEMGGLNLKDVYKDYLRHASRLYNDMLEAGVAPEMARMVLPQSMMTSWIWTGSLAAYVRVYKLRIDSHAQKEIQHIAGAIKNIVEPLFPVSWAALNKV